MQWFGRIFSSSRGVFSGSMLIFRGVSNGILGKISSFHNLSSTTRTILCASKKSFHPSSFSHALLWPGFLRSKKCVKSCAFSSFQLLPIFCVTRTTNNYIHDYTWICWKNAWKKFQKKNILPNGGEWKTVMYRRPFHFFDFRNPLEVNSMSKFLLTFFRGPSENEPKKTAGHVASGWWFQSIWKILVKMEIFPK